MDKTFEKILLEKFKLIFTKFYRKNKMEVIKKADYEILKQINEIEIQIRQLKDKQQRLQQVHQNNVKSITTLKDYDCIIDSNTIRKENDFGQSSTTPIGVGRSVKSLEVCSTNSEQNNDQSKSRHKIQVHQE